MKTKLDRVSLSLASSARQVGKVGQVIRPCSAMSFSSACSNVQYLIASRDAVNHQSRLMGKSLIQGSVLFDQEC